MSSNEMENEADHEIPAKRLKTDNTSGANRIQFLSGILQREIAAEIKLRISDLETIEENIFLTKKALLKVRQGAVSDYYRQKNPKEPLQYPPHPAIQDTFIGKRPRVSCKPSHGESNLGTEGEPLPESRHSSEGTRAGRREKRHGSSSSGKRGKKHRRHEGGGSTTDRDRGSSANYRPPCQIQPNLPPVKTVKPPEPRGYISKKQIRIVVGNVSKWLAPEESSRATHKWTVYTKTTEPNLDLSDFVSKVVFFLHPSYKPNDVVPVVCPPFKLTRRGWGEFPLKARFYFKNPLDNPVDLVHVLKLDNKRTGLETFGSETTLTVWIHFSPDEEDKSPPRENTEKEPREEIVQKQEIIEQNLEEIIVKEEKSDFPDFDESQPDDNNLIPALENSIVIKAENLSNLEEMKTSIKEEPEEIIFDEQIIPNDDPSIIIYDSNILNSLKTENVDYNFIINNGENEFSDLNNDSTLLDGTVSSDFLNGNVSASSQEPNPPVFDFVSVVDPPPNEDTTVCENVDFLMGADEFMDECNIVESEVVIDCDEGPSKREETLKPSIPQPLVISSSVTTKTSKNLDRKSSIPPHSSVNKKQGKNSRQRQNTSHTSRSSKKSNSKQVTKSKKIPTPEVVILNQNVIQQPTQTSFINLSNFQFVDNNFRIITTKTIDNKSSVPLQYPDNKELLNSIEITDNGKTLAAAPNVKILDNSGSVATCSKLAPRKVIVRKLNGEVATILAPVSPDQLPKSVKLAAASQARVIMNSQNPGKSFKVVQTNRNIVSPVKSLVIPSYSLQQVKPLLIETPLNPLPSATVTTGNSKRTNNKEMKSTLIMFQKENGEVILKKEAKFSDCKDENPPTSMKNLSKVTFGGTTSLKKEHGKDLTGGKVHCISVLPLQSNNNMKSCSVIGIQPKGSTSSSDALAKEVVPSGKIIYKNPVKNISTLQPPATVQNSSLSELGVLKASDPRTAPKDFNSSLLSECPRENSEVAVSWLVRHLPLTDPRAATLPGFRSRLPYCAPSREEFLAWPFAKQRAAEWARARHVVKLLNKMDNVDKWTTLQVYDWARIRAFTPLPPVSAETVDDPSPSSPPSGVSYVYNQPTSEIIDYIKKCKDLKENEDVDVETVDDLGGMKVDSGPENSSLIISSVGAMNNKPSASGGDGSEEVKHPPPLEEPELRQLQRFIRRCLTEVGAVSSPEVIASPPRLLYPAADRLLISVFRSVAEDIIRRSYSAAWIRNNERPPSRISLEDVQMGVLSRKELDILVPLKEERRERPPVSVLPNFS